MSKKITRFILFVSFIIAFTNYNRITARADTITQNTSPQISTSQYEKNINGMEKISIDQYISKLDSGEKFIVFIGFKECPHCRKFSPVMKQFIEETTNPIYYLDYGPNGSFNKATQISREKFFNSFTPGFKFMGTPTVAVISNGKVMSMTVGDDTTLNDLHQINSDYNDIK